MNTQSGQRYVRDHDRGVWVPESPTTLEDPAEREKASRPLIMGPSKILLA